MAYTEIKERNGKKYYYRVKSIRKNNRVSKDRIYLGGDLAGDVLFNKEKEADKNFENKKINKSISGMKSKIVNVFKKNGIKKAGIFGSYARGEQRVSSDIDILIEPTREMGFFDIVRIEDELGKKLNKKIDLITYASIHKLLREKILDEEIRII
ncbi:MAG: nucleotidyltransferase family protein [archaeon]